MHMGETAVDFLRTFPGKQIFPRGVFPNPRESTGKLYPSRIVFIRLLTVVL